MHFAVDQFKGSISVMSKGTLFRSSHRKCSIKKGVLRNFAKFIGKHLCQSLFFNKVGPWPATWPDPGTGVFL